MEYDIAALIGRYIELTSKEADLLREGIPIKSFTKGALLLKEGQIANASYFVLEGCVRQYYLLDGEEKTTAFFVEEDNIASIQSYRNQKPSSHYLECLEDTTVAALTLQAEADLCAQIPSFERLCRMSMEEDYGETREQHAKFVTSSPEERYKVLLSERPDLLQRVPQYQLASYLGIKPESLSRIRKRIAKQG